jgi:hypothetical protein
LILNFAGIGQQQANLSAAIVAVILQSNPLEGPRVAAIC